MSFKPKHYTEGYRYSYILYIYNNKLHVQHTLLSIYKLHTLCCCCMMYMYIQ